MEYQEAIKFFGSQVSLAHALGLTQPSIWEWKHKGIPDKRQLEIERATAGQLKADPEIKKRLRALLGEEAA